MDTLRHQALQKEKDAKPVNTTSQRSMYYHIVQQYYTAVTKFTTLYGTTGSGVLGITCQTSQFGHKDTLMIAVWDPHAQTAAWMPPMVMTSDAETGREVAHIVHGVSYINKTQYTCTSWCVHSVQALHKGI